MIRFAIPLVIFLAIAMLLWRGLDLNPREIPSVLIDKPAPSFSLPQLHDAQGIISEKTLAGKVWLLNVWASSPAPCATA